VNARAAVLRRTGTPLAVETVTLDAPSPGDVLVRTVAASICHTDLEVIEGELRYPLPMVLGHEVAGVVEEVGSGVSSLAPGDPVALHWNPHCGHCFYCDAGQPILCEPYARNRALGTHFDGRHRHRLHGESLNVLMYLGGFAEYCLVPEQSAVRMPDGMPLDRACLLGCGVMTGFGAATRGAPVAAGESGAVIGCGAIGLSALQGARIAGAGSVVAIDRNPARLETAAALGADETVDASGADAAARVRERTAGRGADVVFEAAGNEDAFRLSMTVCRPGGRVVWLGKVNVDREVRFRWGTLMGERRVVRSSYGGARPHRDFPLMARAYLDGRLRLDELVTDRVPLERINDGFDALRAGRAIRTVVTF